MQIIVLEDPGSMYQTTDTVQNFRPCICSLIRFHIIHAFGIFHFFTVFFFFLLFSPNKSRYTMLQTKFS